MFSAWYHPSLDLSTPSLTDQGVGAWNDISQNPLQSGSLIRASQGGHSQGCERQSGLRGHSLVAVAGSVRTVN